MTKRNLSVLRKKWVVITVVLVVFLALFVFAKNSKQPKPSETIVYKTYQSPQYGFSIEYPSDWQVYDGESQFFRQGDVVSFSKSGPTQGAQTEPYDGGGVTIAKPIEVDLSLKEWVRGQHQRESQFSKETINNILFEKVLDCSYGCSTDYYTMMGNDVFAISTYARGPDKQIYENTINAMLRSLKFTQ